MLELIAIALLQISSLSIDNAPVGGDTTPDPTPILTTVPGDQGHGGWGGGLI